jgi:ubiquinol-cytochrome c reductase cytochrome c1 subunit
MCKAIHPSIHPPIHPSTYLHLYFMYYSARRGYQVYKQVCAACHSMKYMYYRNLVGAVLTEDEARAEAAEASSDLCPQPNIW